MKPDKTPSPPEESYSNEILTFLSDNNDIPVKHGHFWGLKLNTE